MSDTFDPVRERTFDFNKNGKGCWLPIEKPKHLNGDHCEPLQNNALKTASTACKLEKLDRHSHDNTIIEPINQEP